MDANSAKNFFFDRAAVADKVPPAIKKALSQLGAFVRRRGKSSLKYGTKPSAPGKPPTVHRSKRFTRKKKSKGKVTSQPASPLRELLYFAFEPTRKSMVAGPVLGGGRSGAPEALEHGGTSVALIDGRRTRIRVRKRPTMEPALAAEAPKAAGLFKDLIR